MRTLIARRRQITGGPRRGRPVGSSDDRERLRPFLEDFARELGDEAPLSSTITRVLNIFQATGVAPEQWSDLLYQARGLTQEHTAQIRKTATVSGDQLRRKIVGTPGDPAAPGIPGIVDVDTTLKLDKPEVLVDIDRERAAALGIDVQEACLAPLTLFVLRGVLPRALLVTGRNRRFGALSKQDKHRCIHGCGRDRLPSHA